MGPPGAGKGTQAQRISEAYQLMHISTGDLLRGTIKDNSELGRKARVYMERGELVPDELVTALVRERLRAARRHRGFILDGYPRNQAQALALDEILAEEEIPLDLVVHFETPVEVVRDRLMGRRVCSSCGTNFHLKALPPSPNGRCSRCGGELMIRPDDQDQTVEQRIRVYEDFARPLVKFYRKKDLLHKVSGAQTAGDQYAELKRLFERKAK